MTCDVINSLERVWVLSLALAMTTSFRMIAVIATRGFLPALDEALVEGLEVWIVFAGGEGGHEEDPFDFGSSAAGSAIGVGLAALIWVGRKACEGGGLAAGERAEPGHQGDEGGGGLGADAFDGDEGFDGVGDGLALGGQGVDVGVDALICASKLSTIASR